MGGHKKHKGQQSQSTSRKSQQVQPSLSKQHLKQQKVDMQSSNAGQTGAEEKMTSIVLTLRNARKDILVAVLASVALVAVILVVVAFHFVAPLFREDSLSMKSGLNARRVTTLDHDIVSGNVLLDGPESEILSDAQQDSATNQDAAHPYGSAVFDDFDLELRESTVHPTLCKDGVTMGFSDWPALKTAVQEANALSAERFLRWNDFFSTREGQGLGVFEDGSMYYEEDVIFTICPGATLKSRRSPIFINAENLIIECEYCTFDGRGTHLSFGPHAKHVLVRGITFRGAHTSSLTFHHDGAEASFEDCYWVGNVGNGKIGAVADVNSTASVAFYRCEIADTKYVPRAGQGRGSATGVASSLTIRGP